MALTIERRHDSIGPGADKSASDRLAVPKPLYSQVRDMLAQQIISGHWKPGALLPNEGALAQRFGVSIGTIRRAVEGLEDIGIVSRRQGRGTFIADIGGGAAADRLCRLRTPAGERLNVQRLLLAATRRPASAVEADTLDLADGGDVVELRLEARSGSAVIGHERHVVPALADADYAQALEAGKDIHEVLAEAGMIVTRAEESVSLVVAEAEDGAVLGTRKGELLLQIERCSIALDERIVELATCRYLPASVSYAASIG